MTDIILPLLKQRINCPSAHFLIIDMCNKVYKRCKNFNPEKKKQNLLVITYIYRGYAATHLKGSGACVGSHLTSIIRMRLRTWLLLSQSLPPPTLFFTELLQKKHGWDDIGGGFWNRAVNVNGFSDCGMSLPFVPLTRKDALPALTGNGSRHIVLHRHKKLTNTCWHYFNLLWRTT